MIGIGVSLRHLRGTTAAAAALDAYAVAGFSPALVFDFDDEYYRTGGTETTFDSAMPHSRDGNATMVDSDGLLKWAPHNLLTWSEDFSSGSWPDRGNVSTTFGVADPLSGASATTVTATANGAYIRKLFNSGADSSGRSTTVWVRRRSGTGIIRLYGVGALTLSEIAVTSEWQSFTVSGTYSANYYVGLSISTSGDAVDIYGFHHYRSDLGGMVNNPDTGDSYVPTTSSAVYLPRRGHHVYNGTSWVNEGLLHESEARTNLLTYSEEIASGTGQWEVGGGSAALIQDALAAPSGEIQAVKLEETSTTGSFFVYSAPFSLAASNVTASCYVKAGERNYANVQCYVDSGVRHSILVDLTDGSIVETNSTGTPTIISTGVDSVGNGWYRAHVSLAHTSGNVAIVISPSNTATPSYIFSSPLYNGTAGNGIYIYGAQLEAGSTPSSYIPTSGATATRAADDADSDNLTYDSSAMWFTLSGLQTFADEGVAGQEVLFDWRADANNRITVTIDTDGAETGEITLTVVSGGTTWSVAQDYLSPGVNVPFSIAWRVTDTEINVAAGGTSATAVATTSIPDLSSASAAFGGNGVYSLFRQGVGDLGDSGIAEASTNA